LLFGDKGMNTGENIAYNILHKNGYIYAQTVRGANADLKILFYLTKDMFSMKMILD